MTQGTSGLGGQISKHKIRDKHRLKYDSIFKGKKEYITEEEDSVANFTLSASNYDVDPSRSYYEEKFDQFELIRLSDMRTEMHDIISKHSKIDLSATIRRKPSKKEFNMIYGIIADTLDMQKYTYTEIFVEFAQYYSDNLENMFKFLDEGWGGKISAELIHKSKEYNKNKMDDIDFF